MGFALSLAAAKRTFGRARAFTAFRFRLSEPAIFATFCGYPLRQRHQSHNFFLRRPSKDSTKPSPRRDSCFSLILRTFSSRYLPGRRIHESSPARPHQRPARTTQQRDLRAYRDKNPPPHTFTSIWPPIDRVQVPRLWRTSAMPAIKPGKGDAAWRTDYGRSRRSQDSLHPEGVNKQTPTKGDTRRRVSQNTFSHLRRYGDLKRKWEDVGASNDNGRDHEDFVMSGARDGLSLVCCLYPSQ